MRAAVLAFILGSSLGTAYAGELGGILAPISPRVLPPEMTAGQAGASNGRAAQPAQVLNEAEVLLALQQELIRQLNVEGELKLTFARAWTPIRVASADWKLSLVQAPASGLSSSMLLHFRIEAAGRPVGEWQQVFRGQLWKSVWQATRRLDRGQVLDASLCSVQPVDTLRERQALVPADTDLSLYEMAQTVSQERPLAWRDIILRPLVRKGQAVEVIANDGPLSISMKGVAMSNGGAGESITVRNPDSRKDFSARVIGANTVQVAF